MICMDLLVLLLKELHFHLLYWGKYNMNYLLNINIYDNFVS